MMSYKITTITGIAHGHAVSLMLPVVFDYMIKNKDLLNEPRGKKYYVKMLKNYV